MVRQIDGEIAANNFDYAKWFPKGTKLALFAPKPVLEPEGPPAFDAWARGWIETRQARLGGGTYYDRTRMIEGAMIPFFGDRPVHEIDSEEVERFVAFLRARPAARKAPEGEEQARLSGRRVNMFLQVLRQLLDPVVRKGWLRINPAREVDRLREAKPIIAPLSFAEVKAFLAALRSDDPDHARAAERVAELRRYFTVAFFTGLRPGEQMALQWPSIDWHARPARIGVVSGITRRGGETAPKTDSSYRDVEMLPNVEAALRVQRAASELKTQYVFPNARGGALDVTNLRERVWKPTLRRAGLRARTMYQTRHTFATLMLAVGESPAWIAAQMGHTSAEMIFKHYTKYVPNLTRQDGSAAARELKKQGF